MDEGSSAWSPEKKDMVNVHDDRELRYWMKALGATEDELRLAIGRVGSKAGAIRTHLQSIRQ